jgi:hypothetical protein
MAINLDNNADVRSLTVTETERNRFIKGWCPAVGAPNVRNGEDRSFEGVSPVSKQSPERDEESKRS